jgi:8-oxo-dGTP pyrophosphatase MutT (NUDIX family)
MTARASDLRRLIVSRLEPLSAWRSDADVAFERYGLFEGEPVPAAVLVGLLERPSGYSVLLTRRADTLRRHTGQVAFPGGRCDPGETPWDTALREAEEEIGLERRFVTLAGLGEAMVTGTGYMITPVVGFVEPGFHLTPNPHEVAEIFETPLGFLMDPANHEERETQMPDGKVLRHYQMTHEERRIWGATARILRTLYERLQGVEAA